MPKFAYAAIDTAGSLVEGVTKADTIGAARSILVEQNIAVPPGDLVLAEGTLALGTVDGVLRLDEVQPAGKRRMSGAEYRRGRRL